MSNDNIPFNKLSIFKVRIINITCKNLCLGVATQNMFINCGNYYDKEFLNYYFNSQNIWRNGAPQNNPTKLQIRNGDLVTIEVNLIANTIGWKIN